MAVAQHQISLRIHPERDRLDVTLALLIFLIQDLLVDCLRDVAGCGRARVGKNVKYQMFDQPAVVIVVWCTGGDGPSLLQDSLQQL